MWVLKSLYIWSVKHPRNFGGAAYLAIQFLHVAKYSYKIETPSLYINSKSFWRQSKSDLDKSDFQILVRFWQDTNEA